MAEFEPAFFFGAKFSIGSGSQRKTRGKKKLALTYSNFANKLTTAVYRRWVDA